MGTTNFDTVQANSFIDSAGNVIGGGDLALTEGNIFIGNSSGVSAELDVSTDTQILVGNGTTATSVAVSGDATLANNGALTIANGAIENAMIAQTDGTAGLTAPLTTAVVVYDFSVDGGTAGTITLTGSPTIPDNAVVWVDSYDVLTTCTSSSDASTITLQLPTDGVLFTAIAISDASNPWDAGAFAVNTGALAAQAPKKCTAARVPSLLVAGGENITAGKIVFHLCYWVSQ